MLINRQSFGLKNSATQGVQHELRPRTWRQLLSPQLEDGQGMEQPSEGRNIDAVVKNIHNDTLHQSSVITLNDLSAKEGCTLCHVPSCCDMQLPHCGKLEPFASSIEDAITKNHGQSHSIFSQLF